MSKLHRFATILVLFYIPARLKCGVGADAGINNLNFLKDILTMVKLVKHFSKALLIQLVSF